ncbi:MAG: hypothetical protein NC180_02620 [Muribaculaceae bacterium]|nr:hypothetical protein [Roseburia sp.]MCM1431634.1 hypothetical protein [Muribaculaceae bacterium]MCM1492099.1 hypothetical protein [Muribaculaceae bacterium]
MISCPSCGGNVKFDIPSQKLTCDFCHERFDPYAFEDKTKDAEESTSSEQTEDGEFEVTIFTCPQCGGEILSTDNAAAGFCSFCGASTILYSRISHERRPNFIIPFKKTKEDCKQAYAELMKKAIFAPKELKDPSYIDSFRGIYMPYWAFFITQKGAMEVPAYKEYRRGDYVYKDHYNLDGRLDAYYKGLSYDASSSYDDSISETLAPYDLKGMKAFTPAYLSGFYADTADVAPSVYQPEAEATATEQSVKQLGRVPAFSGYSIKDSAATQALHTKTEHVDSTMFPVWFMSYRRKDRVAYVTVNGQTGKIAADIPIAPMKYFLSSLLLAVPLFFVLMLFTLLPKVLVGITIFLAVLALILYSVEIGKIRKKDSGADDRGRLYKKGIRIGTRTTAPSKKSSADYWISAFVIIIVLFNIWPLFALLPGTIMTTLLVGAGAIALFVIIVKLAKKPKASDGLPELPSSSAKSVVGYISSILAIVLGALVLILHPVSDLYYYSAGIGGLVAVGLCMWDIIRNYNILSTRPLPQFEKQGGDDRA